MHQLLADAIARTDLDLRASLFGGIVLSGGATLTKGFGDRLLHEVRRLAVKDTRIKIFAPPERKYSTWIGGSILAGLSTFRKVSDDLHLSIAAVVPAMILRPQGLSVWSTKLLLHQCSTFFSTRYLRLMLRNSGIFDVVKDYC